MFTVRRASGPPHPEQRRILLGFRENVDRCERWEICRDDRPVYDLWLQQGTGDLFDAGGTGLALAAIRRGMWDVRISDPSPSLDREVTALRRAWEQRSDP